MFLAMISEPASPNPNASSAPILVMVFSKITVSKGASFLSSPFPQFMHPLLSSSIISDLKYSSLSAFCIASKGFIEISLILDIILSIGSSTMSFVSFEKLREPIVRTKQMKMVFTIFKIESSLDDIRLSKSA